MKKLFIILLACAMLLTACNTADKADTDKSGSESKPVKTTDKDKVQGTDKSGSEGKGSKTNDKVDKPRDDMEGYEDAFIVSKDKLEILVYKKETNGSLYFCNIKDAKIFLDNKESSIDELQAGMTVKIDFSGPIMESYPAQMSSEKVYASSLVKNQVNDKIGFYVKVFTDLWDEDKALQADTKYLGIDIDKGPIKLDEVEKQALGYVLWGEFEKEVVFTNIKNLTKEGKIKDHTWKDGVLLTVSADKYEDNASSVIFSCEKWRSGTGAIGYNNCKARWDDKGHLEEIEYKDPWIS